MTKGDKWSARWLVLLILFVFLSGAFVACGGGGSSGSRDLWVKRFSVPNFTGILLDEAISFVMSVPIREDSLNHDSIRIRTGPQGGKAPRGSFFKGTFLIDPSSSTRVVIDPDQMNPALIDQVEKEALVSLIPEPARYDLSVDHKSPFNGNRRVLFDSSKKHADRVIFVPEVPNKLDMSDTGYEPGAFYSVVVPSFPSLNTVVSEDNDPMLPRDGRIFTSSFITVPDYFPFLFLAGESNLQPHVVNTAPPNGADAQPSTVRINLRFSQPLDPRTVDPTTIILEVLTFGPDPFWLGLPPPPIIQIRQQIPVSLFLRQTRLGTVEVVLTPLQDLPVAAPGSDAFTFEVTVTGGVTDLVGDPVIPFVMSFTTGGEVPDPGDIVESFVTNTKEDQAVTTANWNGRFNYVGAEGGALVASFAPFAGSGLDGSFVPTIGEVTELHTGLATPITFNYTDVLVNTGADVFGSGRFGLVIRSQTDIVLDGPLSVDGGTGGDGGVGNALTDPPNGGGGGLAGPGGFDGGDGAMHIHDASNFHGMDGLGLGGGRGGHTGDQERNDGNPANNTRPAVMREGGGGGAYSTGGSPHNASLSGVRSDLGPPNTGGFGGVALAAIIPPVVGVLNAGFGGSGGAGGGGEDDIGQAGQYGDGIANGVDEGGGGGGGGGGGLHLVAYGDIVVNSEISADGGAGGSSVTPQGGTGQGAPGGGGSGGAVWAQANGQILIDTNAKITALGGIGGTGDGNGDDLQTGGLGGEGYIFLQDNDGSIVVPSGVQPTPSVSEFVPPLLLDSTARSIWYNQFISTPNYGAPTVNFDLGPVSENNKIRVYVQGAREDVTLPGPQPVDPDVNNDPSLVTAWVKIFDSELGGVLPGAIDALDNFQYLRFRVEFQVDPIHPFAEDLPKITEIRVPVSVTPDKK